ncbi:S-layer protein SlaB [Metallosphaera hakonensis]|uniref:Alpha-2-macroglobulin n=1 Tax=Metallosphaera hakonensis JCM 8857 = DSM 7519 TaxID=1293036 RepID=A0A2U9IV49_9CREN|nr:S-layer protein SlaB [Metallosphaera hakonensis]AWR99898.1 alpha-2-macroglobulin [Metallosphaera hakonensis JCM 8857 = DSM 7519]
MKYNFIPLVLLVLLTIPLMVQGGAPPITVTTAPVYHPGETVFIEGTTSPNTLVGVTIYNPLGKAIYSNTTESNAQGQYSLKAFTFPSQATSTLPYGTYTVNVGTQSGFTNSTTFQFEPLTATVLVQVINPQGVPVQGAAVSASSVSGVTNASGEVVLNLPSGTYTLKVVPPAPYAPTSENITVVAPQSYTFKLTVQIQELVLTVAKAISPNVELTNLSPGTAITVVGGSTLTLMNQVTFAGAPVSTANVTAVYNGTTYTATYMNGYYVINITVPNVQYETDITVTASYSGMSTSVTLPLTVNVNEQAIIEKLNATITSLETQISSLSTEVSSLTSTVSSLSSTVSSLSHTLSTLNSTVTSLSGSISTLNSEYTTLNNRVNALSGLSGTVDIALAVSIIAIIISIVVLILVFRKIS